MFNSFNDNFGIGDMGELNLEVKIDDVDMNGELYRFSINDAQVGDEFVARNLECADCFEIK